MTSTLDNTHNNIMIQIDTLDEIINWYKSKTLEPQHFSECQNSSDSLEDIRQTYLMTTINMVKDYGLTMNVEQRKHIYNNYVKAFHSANTIGSLKRIYNFCKKLDKIYKFTPTRKNTDLAEMYKKFDFAVVDERYDDKTSDVCKFCNIVYEIEEDTSHYICGSCGYIEKMHGAVFEDEQFFYQEGQRTKHCKYDPSKHCKFWVDRIQAKENTEIPEQVIQDIKKCMRRDKLWIDNLNCETIRKYLKQLKQTTFNIHVPLIKKIITGVEPPQFTDYETKLIFLYFGMVTQIFNKIKPSNKSNSLYLPYFIYKIVEHILQKSNPSRKTEILSCIHLQSRETLIENDKLWFSICEHIPEFNQTPTN